MYSGGSALLRRAGNSSPGRSLAVPLGGVGDVVGVLRGGAVLSAVGVAVFRAVFVELFGPADSRTGRVAMGVAVPIPVLVAVLPVVVMAVFAGVLVAMVVVVSSHRIPPIYENFWIAMVSITRLTD